MTSSALRNGRMVLAVAVAVLTTALVAVAAPPASARGASSGPIPPCLQDSGEPLRDPCEPVPECSDGWDNDGDGRIDYGDDPGCESPFDDSEDPDPPQCSDAIDNDGDGRTDYPADRGCEGPSDDDETDPPSRVVDFDGDGRTDRAVFRPSATGATFHVLSSRTGSDTTVRYGLRGDIPALGDYDGDQKTDYAVWRPSDGIWYVLLSGSNNKEDYNKFGLADDIPVPGDYDGDGRTDRAVFRPSTGTWWVVRSSDGGVSTQQWGQNGDKPALGDYDDDKKNDYAVWRPSDGTWYVLLSGSNNKEDYQPFGHGRYRDIPLFFSGFTGGVVTIPPPL